MNLFHAVQYLGLVWASESTRVLRRLRLEGRRYGRLIGGALGLAAVCGYGFLAKAANPSRELFWSVTIVVSLLHFWYDGFIWSVRKREI